MTKKEKIYFATLDELDKRFFVGNKQAIQAFIVGALEDYFQTGDREVLRECLALVVKWQGAADIAKKAKISRQSVYNAIKPAARPEFTTVANLLHGAGFDLTVTSSL